MATDSLGGTASAAKLPTKAPSWRTPAVIVACGCAIAMISFGPRSALGLFLTPMSAAHGWGREVFALSVAMQTLLYGAAQPFSGAIADRFGTIRVIIAGVILYATGIFMMAHAATPALLYLSSGVLIGFGLSGCSFNLIISAFGKLLPPAWRSLAFGAGTASGSFGQFLFSPLGVSLIDTLGWRTTLEVFAGLLLLIIPFAFAVATPPADTRGARERMPGEQQTQTYREALAEAFGHRSFLLLVLGFFTCGFQLGFVTLHLPAYLVDRGLSAEIGGWTLGVIGLFNIVGAMLSGWLGGFLPGHRVQVNTEAAVGSEAGIAGPMRRAYGVS
jgi:MFS family permease